MFPSWVPLERGTEYSALRRKPAPGAKHAVRPVDRFHLGFGVVISTNQFKNGSHIEIDGKIFRIVEFQHVKPGKGGAFVRTKLRKLDDGSVQDKTFRAGEKFRPVRTESRRMQYLYDSGDAAVFMDNNDYEQIEIPRETVGEAMQWLLPNADVEVLFVDERPSDVQVPSAIEMKVTTTEPGVKGDTASGGGNKPATLESGVTVQVPLFIEEGEVIRIDTRSGEYVSRA
jgi:elongation factor P